MSGTGSTCDAGSCVGEFDEHAEHSPNQTTLEASRGHRACAPGAVPRDAAAARPGVALPDAPIPPDDLQEAWSRPEQCSGRALQEAVGEAKKAAAQRQTGLDVGTSQMPCFADQLIAPPWPGYPHPAAFHAAIPEPHALAGSQWPPQIWPQHYSRRALKKSQKAAFRQFMATPWLGCPAAFPAAIPGPYPLAGIQQGPQMFWPQHHDHRASPLCPACGAVKEGEASNFCCFCGVRF